MTEGPITRRTALALTAGAATLAASPAARAGASLQSIVEDSARAAKAMRRGARGDQVTFLLRNARGALVFPSLLKGGFFLGGEGGNGVLLGRSEAGGWSNPAFYTLGAASIGLQFGIQDSQVMILLMNDIAFGRALDNDFKLGADMSVALGEEGVDKEFSTANLLRDAYIFAETKQGVFGGASFEGAGIIIRKEFNQSYYQDLKATPRGIVIDRNFVNADADGLVAAMSA